MTRKALVVTTVPGTVASFLMPQLSSLRELGYEVHVACNFGGVSSWSAERGLAFRGELSEGGYVPHQVDFTRSPRDVRGVARSLRQVRALLDAGDFSLVHVHTPIAAAVTRAACARARRRGTKVLYTAHGFHFHDGAPLANWLLYYPVERALTRRTDLLITIAREDYERARRFARCEVAYVPGVGVDLARLEGADGELVRRELGLGPADKLLLSVGELNRNKDHQLAVRALAELDDPRVTYAVAGEGPERGGLEELARELGVGERVRLLGFREDVPDLMAAADAYVLPSLREGLNVSLMEAMGSGLPCVARRIRGNVDLIDDGKGGVLVEGEDPSTWARAVERALSMDRAAVAKHNRAKAEAFSLDKVRTQMQILYQGV